MGLTPLAVGGLALSAAGTGLNYAQQRGQRKKAERIQEEAVRNAERNRQAARARWQEALGQVTPGGVEEALAEETAERSSLYDELTADVAEQTNVIPDTGDSPRVVKTYAAKKLGDELARAKEQMAAFANLGGWSDTLSRSNMAIGRSGQDVSQLANFSQGYTSAAGQDATATRAARPAVPVGDILQGIGSIGTAAGGAGAGSMATIGAKHAGGPALGGLIPQHSWWTTPITFGGKAKAANAPIDLAAAFR